MTYKLHNGTELVQVCRKTFLNTTGLGRFTVESWKKESVYDMNESKGEFNKQRKNRNNRVRAFEDSKAFPNLFFDDLPKQPSHYVGKDTSKFYLEQHFVTLKQLHNFYREVCDEKNKHCLGIKVFKQIFKENNLSLFSPKKDRCDICIEQENGNIDSSIWSKHIEDKEKARKEKTEIRRKL
ncbi:unnamed protein product [Acanthoscelides obtectus]|uniref:Uncharacterized protein n=1 Tax=Acanthoscelides obtectus TaxID=200917 RepID=A0A9P0P378_ACAOB|nr:unnamed protein product [Acanthoscelides obtectus]CAK1643767.1 hypothetical protein AOBTE_LOCUS13668 [Acanthoscelides obtectus]